MVPLLVLIPPGRQRQSEADRTWGHGGIKAGGAADGAAGRWAALMHMVVHRGGPAQERRAVHAQPAVRHVGPGLVDRTLWPVAGAGRLHCRHADCRNRIQAQVETDIRPFHDVLLGLFFITIGMKLDWHSLIDHGPWFCCSPLLPVLFKFGLITCWPNCLAPHRRGPAHGLYLAQAGEFGFVLLSLATTSCCPPA